MKRFSMRAFVLVFVCLGGLSMCRADELAAVTGLVTDPNGRSVPGVTVIITNLATNVASRTVTNDQGIYRVSSLQPGIYRMTLDKDGFKSIVKAGVELHVQDVASINFELQIGSVNETVTVEAGGPVINTTDGTVSTVVDRQFAENLPLNGRSFQTLIQLTPGVVLTPINSADGGQFSVNGQRSASNYWTVDGVSANIGVSALSPSPGNGFSGSLGSFSVQGGTNSLVSVDALQEFRIQTSTYAPEFGRTPGAQISIVTRSGTNQFHGTAFDYLRNDLFDANDWFANQVGLPKPQERQNDFGGVLGGPIAKDKTFFFFSYEGLRLRLPGVTKTTVPDLSARQAASPALQPYLNAFSLPNGTDNPATGVAQFNASFSEKSTLDAYSLRIDHRFNEKLSIFGRYNYSPSELVQRGANSTLSTVSPTDITTQTGTVGATWVMSSTLTNDLRFNYSKTNASGSYHLDNFAGAVPLSGSPFPSPYTDQNGQFLFFVFSLTNGALRLGEQAHNEQQQVNLVDSLSVQKGSHGLKLGADFRGLFPLFGPQLYSQFGFFNDVPSAETGNLAFSITESSRRGRLLFRNLGGFAQDTWRIIPSLTMTYGLRWDIDFAPSSLNGPSLVAVTGFNFSNLSTLALAPAGTPPYSTTYNNFAPRVGIAYQISHRQDWASVVRGGFGAFYDLVTSEVGNTISFTSYPFGTFQFTGGGTFPLSASAAAPPPIVPPGGGSGRVLAFNPHIDLPYTLQWNAAVEQALGPKQFVSASYIGSVGRRLLQTALVNSPNPNFGSALLVSNGATSNYNALQIQFQRQLSRGLQALASYTWSHSIDDGSAGSAGTFSNTFVPGTNEHANRGASDFDIRSAFSLGLTFDIPTPKINAFANSVLRGWSLQSVVQARSASPVNVYNFLTGFGQLFNAFTQVRPDVVSGIPFYLYGSQYPGGKALNNTPNQGGPGCTGPFCPPPKDSKGNPVRQGDLGRNALRGFGATQWDFGVHRDFPIRESLKLQFRAEMFNILNHPNFGQPIGDLSGFAGPFGQSNKMLGQYLNGGLEGGGAFDSLYQIGGPRSVQFALKLAF